jgi:hypothetical protein
MIFDQMVCSSLSTNPCYQVLVPIEFFVLLAFPINLQESYPEARRLVDSGEMIPDQMVCDLLLEALLLDEPGLQDDLGFVVDGFPRTATQVRTLVLCLSVCQCDVLLLF